MMDDFLAILGAIALIIATVLVLPFISFWLCYFGGWVASIWFTKDMIPLCAGTLGWIGSYFKTSNLGKSKD